MSTAFVLMTALPPTKGHLHLIEFACEITKSVCLIVPTQPGEPYPGERVAALEAATAKLPVRLVSLHQTLPQRPEDAENFWEMWVQILQACGLGGDDYIVASELYGQTLADAAGCTFMPYDVDRLITPVRASAVRADPVGRFADVLPEFQPVLRRTVTVLGAESTGKTTLSRALATEVNGHWLPEWARGYLEHDRVPTVTNSKMLQIFFAQGALQRQARRLVDKPYLIHDTDLFATVGFWQNWNPASFTDIVLIDALRYRSDLYLITRSNIPFEPDRLRYGGDRRETSDEFWIQLADEHGLNAVVIEASDPVERLAEARAALRDNPAMQTHLAYDRVGQG